MALILARASASTLDAHAAHHLLDVGELRRVGQRRLGRGGGVVHHQRRVEGDLEAVVHADRLVRRTRLDLPAIARAVVLVARGLAARGHVEAELQARFATQVGGTRIDFPRPGLRLARAVIAGDRAVADEANLEGIARLHAAPEGDIALDHPANARRLVGQHERDPAALEVVDRALDRRPDQQHSDQREDQHEEPQPLLVRDDLRDEQERDRERDHAPEEGEHPHGDQAPARVGLDALRRSCARPCCLMRVGAVRPELVEGRPSSSPNPSPE